MKISNSWRAFIGLLLFAAAFVHFTSQSLPDRVASHFAGSGQANGFMARDDYRLFMLASCVVVPLGLAGLLSAVFRSAGKHLNLPNREHWLAPVHHGETVGFLVAHAVWFGAMLVAFLCFVHWRVLEANALHPAHLATGPFVGGLVVFLLAVVVWLGAMFVRFRLRG